MPRTETLHERYERLKAERAAKDRELAEARAEMRAEADAERETLPNGFVVYASKDATDTSRAKVEIRKDRQTIAIWDETLDLAALAALEIDAALASGKTIEEAFASVGVGRKRAPRSRRSA